MTWVLLWLVLSIVTGVVAAAKGRSGFGYFLLAVLLSPLVGLILAAAMPALPKQPQANGAEAAPLIAAVPAELTLRRCPDCAEPVLRQARKCKHCGAALPPPPAGFGPGGDEALVFRTPVAGVALANADGSARQRLIRELAVVNAEVKLLREPDRPGNAQAIAVRVARPTRFGARRGQIGDLGAEVAGELAPLMDAGREVSARIAAVTGGTAAQPVRSVILEVTVPPE